jgi:hypothetical protein
MKTLQLNRAESAAYANGQRRIWRACREPLATYLKNAGRSAKVVDGVAYNYSYEETLGRCPWGKPGDRIRLEVRGHSLPPVEDTIAAITVEQRGGRWGWVVEVGA